jgi:hypothetical protein
MCVERTKAYATQAHAMTPLRASAIQHSSANSDFLMSTSQSLDPPWRDTAPAASLRTSFLRMQSSTTQRMLRPKEAFVLAGVDSNRARTTQIQPETTRLCRFGLGLSLSSKMPNDSKGNFALGFESTLVPSEQPLDFVVPSESSRNRALEGPERRAEIPIRKTKDPLRCISRLGAGSRIDEP